MDVTELGLWLVGVGAAAAVAGLLLEPAPHGRGGLTFNSPESARPVRVRQAVNLVAAVLVASGSIVVAASQSPPWWLVVATAGAVFVAIWLHCAWSQHKLWRDKFAPLARTPFESIEKQGVMGAEWMTIVGGGLRHPGAAVGVLSHRPLPEADEGRHAPPAQAQAARHAEPVPGRGPQPVVPIEALNGASAE